MIVASVAALVLAATTPAQVAAAQRGDVLELRGPGSQIGVLIADTDAGVTIHEVRAGTPAERAGFKTGDVVVTFDGQEIRSARGFVRVVEETPPRKAVTAVVTRAGSRQTLTVTPEAGTGQRLFNFNDGTERPFRGAFQLRLPNVTADAEAR
jgi:S1-C subfamily serine protease